MCKEDNNSKVVSSALSLPAMSMSSGASVRANIRREKVLKYEKFLNERLQPDLRSVLEQREALVAEAAEFAALKQAVGVITSPEAGIKKGQPLKSQVDLGCNFYAQAVVDDPSKVGRLRFVAGA